MCLFSSTTRVSKYLMIFGCLYLSNIYPSSLVFYNLSFHHFLLDLIEEFFLLIFLDFHDSFNVFLFVCPFDDILVMFFLQLLLSLPLNSDEIVLFGLKFLEHTFLIRLLLLFIIIPHPSSFLLLLFLLFSFLLGLDT